VRESVWWCGGVVVYCCAAATVGNNIGPAGAKDLSEMLKHNKTLTAMNLYCEWEAGKGDTGGRGEWWGDGQVAWGERAGVQAVWRVVWEMGRGWGRTEQEVGRYCGGAWLVGG